MRLSEPGLPGDSWVIRNYPSSNGRIGIGEGVIFITVAG